MGLILTIAFHIFIVCVVIILIKYKIPFIKESLDLFIGENYNEKINFDELENRIENKILESDNNQKKEIVVSDSDLLKLMLDSIRDISPFYEASQDQQRKSFLFAVLVHYLEY